MKIKSLIIVLVLFIGITYAQQGQSKTVLQELTEEKVRLQPLVTSKLGTEFLDKVETLNPNPYIPELYMDKVERKIVKDLKSNAIDTSRYQKINVDSRYYYYTRYGTPLAFVSALEALGRRLKSPKRLNILDYGFGTIGHLKLLSLNGHKVTGIEANTFLEALYEDEYSKNDNMELFFGIFPKDDHFKEKLTPESYDVFISKNTLKKGYVNPEFEFDKKYLINIGRSEEEYLNAVFNLLKDDGYFLIYNLHGKLVLEKDAYKPMLDGRSPFTKEQFKNAGFSVIEYNQDDTEFIRKMGKALGWEASMNFDKDLFATYTLVKKMPN